MKVHNRIAWVIGILVVVMLPFAGIVAAQTDDTIDESTPFLGIAFEEAENGVEIVQVVSGSPADDAGITVGDILITIDGESVDFETVADVVAGYAVDDTVTVELLREDETISLEITLGERPEAPEPPNRRNDNNRRFEFQQRLDGAYLGVMVEDSDDGVTIVEVRADSPAEDAGLQEGDIITSVNASEITDSRILVETVQALDSGDIVNITLTRDGEELSIEATLGDRTDIRPLILENMPFMMLDGIEYLEDENVWVINELDEDSPLAEAGLQAGDRITAINGQAYAPTELPQLLMNIDPESPLDVTVERGNETLQIEVDLPLLLPLIGGLRMDGDFGQGFSFNMPRNGDLRDRFEQRGNRNGRFNNNRARLGVTFVMLDEVMATEYAVEETTGALIIEVSSNSPADQAGVQANDVIIAVDGDTVDLQRNLAERLSAYEQGETVNLTIIRDGEEQEIAVTLGGVEQRGFNFGGGFPFDTDVEETAPPVEEPDI